MAGLLAKIVFQHPTIESLCRELGRNSQLRQLCGFQAHGVKVGRNQTKLVLAPHAMSFSRFLKRLSRHKDLIYDMFETLVKELYDRLPDFGRRLAIDGKIIESQAHRPSEGPKGDLRGEHDGSWTKKTYRNKENTVIKTRTYFGFWVHLICDSVYELPIAFRVLPAHVSEKPTARKMEEDKHIDWERVQVASMDSGYEDSKLQGMIEEREVAFLAAGRHLWQEPEARQYRDTSLFYNEEGEVFYKTEEQDFIQLEYRRRTAVERINSRLDQDFRFEDRSIRGMAKMDLFVSIAFIIQLAFACAKLRDQETKHLAAWVV